MEKVAVYAFEVWDQEQCANVVAPRMATAEAIRRIKGCAELETETFVEASELDEQGYYPAKPKA